MGTTKWGARYYLVLCPKCGEQLFIPLAPVPVGGFSSRVCECGHTITIRSVLEGARYGAEVLEEGEHV